MFSFAGGVDWIYYLRNYAVVLGIGILFSTPVFRPLYYRLTKYNAFNLVFFGVILVASTAYLWMPPTIPSSISASKGVLR